MAGWARATSDWIERAFRFSWLSKGFVFVVIGFLAVRIATNPWDETVEDANQAGALRTVADEPLGAVLLIVVGAGLVGFMIWNLAQAVLPHGDGLDLLAVFQRIGWFGLGLFYGTIAVSAVRLGWSELDSPADGTSPATRAMEGATSGTSPAALTDRLLSWPAGRWLVGLAALITMIVAGYHLHKGVTRGFVDDLDTTDLSARKERWYEWLGVLGFAARALVLAVVAVFLFVAAIDVDPGAAVGLDGALRELAELAFGQAVLIATGVGLAVAGIYDMVTFRRQTL